MRPISIDAFRVLAIFLIIVGHTVFFGNLPTAPGAQHVLNLVSIISARWTIPFFFLVSGYLLAKKLTRDPDAIRSAATRTATKVGVLWLVWSGFYAIETPLMHVLMARHGFSWDLPQTVYEYYAEIFRHNWSTLIFEGTRVHLWFLASLVMTLLLYAIIPMFARGRCFTLLGAILYLLGLLGGAYHSSRFGLNLYVDTRDTLFFSTFFFAIGLELRNKTWKLPPRPILWLVTLGGACLLLAEVVLLEHRDGINPLTVEYGLATVPFGIGFSLLAITLPQERVNKSIARLGKYVLGIYCVHMAVMDFLDLFSSEVPTLLWRIVLPVGVFVLSLMAVRLLSRTRVRRFVST